LGLLTWSGLRPNVDQLLMMIQMASVTHEDLAEALRLVKLQGRLDMVGVGEIEMNFVSLAAASNKSVIVDLQDVDFLASVGLRCIIHSAKALDGKGGRMCLVIGDNDAVLEVLDTVGVTDIIPTLKSKDEALSLLAS
jgi:anti-sigma B factor antagonist